MLDEFDQHKIFAVKHGGKQGFIDFMSLACNCDKSVYNDYRVFELLSSLLTEIAKEESTSIVTYFFFEKLIKDLFLNCTKKCITLEELINAQINAISFLQVRKDGHAINGFSKDAIDKFTKIEQKLWPKKTKEKEFDL